MAATTTSNGGTLPQGEYVDPSQAQGAQIPLQSFSLPEFPAQAQGLRALTLTSDLKLDEYQDLLKQPFTIPPLPSSIESLTLELFSLGYPPGWLSQLADRLPNLKSLVIYSQLFGGISNESLMDAVEFFKKLPGLRALHLLDCFARVNFFTAIAPYVTYQSDGNNARRGLMFLEVNYTVQHSDSEFLSQIQASELPKLLGPGLITASFNISEADVTDDPEDPTNLGNTPGEELAKDGVMAFNMTLASALVKALMNEETRPRNLKVLNSTIYTVTLADLRKVLDVHKGLMVLSTTLEVDEHDVFKKELIESLSLLESVETIELVASPSLQFFMAISNTRAKALEKAFPAAEDMSNLHKKCTKLNSLKSSILRSSAMPTVEWELKEDGSWSGGVRAPRTQLGGPK
ncbi:hypothetical protein MBLNU459_g3947t1 [Dothideomycetes sp. NU459]